MQLLDGDTLLDELGIDYFKQGAVFGALSEHTIQYLLSKGTVSKLNKGDVLFQSGERSDSFFIILKGTVAFYKPHQEQYIFLRNFNFGEQIGFASMIALQDRTGKVVAESDAYVVEISCDLFYTLHCEIPQGFGLLMMNLSREMARMIVNFSNSQVAKHVAESTN
ncbi:MAG: cyclic nucleotide-binding domain-containing protein [Amphritea sp.]